MPALAHSWAKASGHAPAMEADFSIFDPRRLLAIPSIYRLSQKLAGGGDDLGRLVNRYLTINPGERVLDIGCGPGDVLNHLAADVDYHGFDIDPNYIAAARTRYGARGTFAVRSVTTEAADDFGTFDVAIAIGVLHHLADPEAAAVFKIAEKVLKPNGRVVTCDGAFVPGQNPIARFLLTMDRGRHIRAPDAYLALARRSFPNATVRVIHDLAAVPYTHCIIEGGPSRPR